MNELHIRKRQLKKALGRFSRVFVEYKSEGKTKMTLTDIDTLIRQEIFSSVLEQTGSKIKSAELLEIHRNLFYTARAK
jgi:hypothetical protein